jgi:hypothetical protein
MAAGVVRPDVSAINGVFSLFGQPIPSPRDQSIAALVASLTTADAYTAAVHALFDPALNTATARDRASNTVSDFGFRWATYAVRTSDPSLLRDALAASSLSPPLAGGWDAAYAGICATLGAASLLGADPALLVAGVVTVLDHSRALRLDTILRGAVPFLSQAGLVAGHGPDGFEFVAAAPSKGDPWGEQPRSGVRSLRYRPRP